MSEEFRLVEKSIEPPLAVLQLGGRIGVKPAQELRELASSLRERGVQHVVMNMSDVSFIASSGIGALIVLTGEFSIQGGSLQLASISEPVKRAIKMLNLSQFLSLANDENEARGVIQSRAS